MKKLLLAAGIGMALGSPMASALNIDFSGSGNIGASVFFPEINWGSNNAVLEGAINSLGGNPVDGNLRVQNKFTFGGPSDPLMTYQLLMPVTITRSDPDASTTFFDLTLKTGSVFSMFIGDDPTNAGSVAPTAGTGYGNVGSIAPLPADQHLIASGEVKTIGTGGKFRISLDNTGGESLMTTNANSGALQKTVKTVSMSGSTNLEVDITTQNSSYVVSDLVNAGLVFDLTVLDLGFSNPFDSTVIASTEVVNYTPFFGKVEGDGFRHQNNVCTPTVDNGICDFQAQTGTNTKFLDKPVPEPGTLALGGLGLALLGFARRRAARKA